MPPKRQRDSLPSSASTRRLCISQRISATPAARQAIPMSVECASASITARAASFPGGTVPAERPLAWRISWRATAHTSTRSTPNQASLPIAYSVVVTSRSSSSFPESASSRERTLAPANCRKKATAIGADRDVSRDPMPPTPK